MIATAALFLASSTATTPPDEPGPEKQWVWLHQQGVWGYGYQIREGPQRGLWRIDPDSKRPPEEESEPASESASDPYGFGEILNRCRAEAGLPPAAYDPDLSAWAVQNNVEQCRRGLGHHVNPNCFQNSGWNYDSALGAAIGWMESPGHRANMLEPSATRYGIAHGPGPYWTMNAR